MDQWHLLIGIFVTLFVILAISIPLIVYFLNVETTNSQSQSQTKYSCSSGQCTEDANGKYDTIESCTDACNRATCIQANNTFACSYVEGDQTLSTMEDCESTCGKSQYICDAVDGCRKILSTEQGIYNDNTCDNMCISTYDIDTETGECVQVPFGTKGPYDSFDTCVEANYTASCTDYINQTCTPDNKKVNVENHFLVSECAKHCNPSKYPACDSSYTNEWHNDGTLPLSPEQLCDGFNETNPCGVTVDGIDFRGKCTYCANTDSMSNLYCDNITLSE